MIMIHMIMIFDFYFIFLEANNYINYIKFKIGNNLLS